MHGRIMLRHYHDTVGGYMIAKDIFSQTKK